MYRVSHDINVKMSRKQYRKEKTRSPCDVVLEAYGKNWLERKLQNVLETHIQEKLKVMQQSNYR